VIEESAENNSKDLTSSDVSNGNANSRDEITEMPISREKFIEQAMLEFESPLIAYAARLLQDTDRARDVVQDTFIRLCQQDIRKVEANLKSWLSTVCRNRALDLLRKDKKIQPIDDIRWKKVAGTGLQPDEVAEHQERIAKITSLLNRLSENQREVLLLKFQQNLNYQEIAAVTGLTTGNIGFLIHTGLKRLRDILPDELR
jgi:RNA polymerase sigma-70 factor (ECF subfamily)